MRIWAGMLILTVSFGGPLVSKAQQVIVTNGVGIIVPNNGVPAAASGVAPAITPQSIAPSLGISNSSPAIGTSSIAPAMPSPGAPAIIPQSPGSRIATQPFTTGIGRQGSGTAIGQQGNTAIGQQGVGTAIVPETNGIIIGQPEPFNPPKPNQVPMVRGNSQNGFTQNMTTPFGGVASNSPAIGVTPRMTPMRPAPVPAPTGRTVR